MATGDLLTPGYAATKDAVRLPREQVEHLKPSIPSLPIFWEDALPLLKATQGRGVRGSVDWVGGLNQVDYCSGPSEGDVDLVNIIDEKSLLFGMSLASLKEQWILTVLLYLASEGQHHRLC